MLCKDASQLLDLDAMTISGLYRTVLMSSSLMRRKDNTGDRQRNEFAEGEIFFDATLLFVDVIFGLMDLDSI